MDIEQNDPTPDGSSGSSAPSPRTADAAADTDAGDIDAGVPALTEGSLAVTEGAGAVGSDNEPTFQASTAGGFTAAVAAGQLLTHKPSVFSVELAEQRLPLSFAWDLDERLVVRSVEQEAEDMGVQPHDHVIAVNGTDVSEDMTCNDIMQLMIAGGRPLTLGLKRGKWSRGLIVPARKAAEGESGEGHHEDEVEGAGAAKLLGAGDDAGRGGEAPGEGKVDDEKKERRAVERRDEEKDDVDEEEESRSEEEEEEEEEEDAAGSAGAVAVETTM
eukprot:g5613.t1